MVDKKLNFLSLSLLTALGLCSACNKAKPSAPPPSETINPQQLQNTLTSRAKQMGEIRTLQTQIAIYEEVLKAAPNSQETRRKIEELRHQLSTLQK